MTLGMNMGLFVWVAVVYNRRSKVNVRVAILPLGEVMVQRRSKKRKEEGTYREYRKRPPPKYLW